MKLYEFTYADNQNLSESELLSRVEVFLQNEASLQGWASDYKFRQCKKAEPLPDSGHNYFFEVNGSYLATDSTRFDDEMGGDIPSHDRLVAKEINP